MSKKELEIKGQLHIVANNKGGVGKSTLAQQVIAVSVFEKSNKDKKITVLEVDDNNDTCSPKLSKVIEVKSFSVAGGIDATQTALDRVFSDENVVIDAGGGNDTNILLDSFVGLGINEFCTFYIPFLKNGNGMKNVTDTYDRIRKDNKESEIVLVFNQTQATNQEQLEREFPAYFGNSSLGIVGIQSHFSQDSRVKSAIVEDSLSFELANNVQQVTAYEIANTKIPPNYMISEFRRGGVEAKNKAVSLLKIKKICDEYYSSTLVNFFKV